ncbi:MAG: hypothetical protein KA756_08265 [Steroidobacteraceae bacterium]|nr:hypothetical protein [Steroidobacteraceae bacterium]MBP7615631.1 hypothetical protein [Steroidobacteraceae bacterium]
MSEPRAQELQALVEQIAERVGGLLERGGLVERDMENAWLAGDGEADPLDDLIGHSITYRIAVGPRAGQKLFTLQTVPPRRQGLEGDANGAAPRGRFLIARGRRDGLGAAAVARVRHRDRHLPALWREAADHCEHRAAGGHREDPRAPRAHGGGTVSARARGGIFSGWPG